MKITYDAEGRILSCSIDDADIPTERMAHVPDDQLPDDFLDTFALGKYRIKEGNVVKARGFASPRSHPLPMSQVGRKGPPRRRRKGPSE